MLTSKVCARENTLEEPLFTRLDKSIQQLKDNIEKSQKAGEEYIE
jgi:hypothetical protein